MIEYIIKVDDQKAEDGSQKILETMELVRCKDCKHYKDDKCFYVMRRHGLEPDWFCADGERWERE